MYTKMTKSRSQTHLSFIMQLNTRLSFRLPCSMVKKPWSLFTLGAVYNLTISLTPWSSYPWSKYGKASGATSCVAAMMDLRYPQYTSTLESASERGLMGSYRHAMRTVAVGDAETQPSHKGSFLRIFWIRDTQLKISVLVLVRAYIINRIFPANLILS